MNAPFFFGEQKAELTVKLKDGRVLRGTYPTYAALVRLEAARKLPDCVSAQVEWL